ncbi:hypothetical protein [Hymenobacter qilianensis]|uniref:hypothetical protein n=1 Tax=Hymenobacter qilianensis TaxID=1385715 RepID=UPI001CB945D2|nr:hypothetical protein [Hymenobacter qilianensis]
MAFKFNPYTPAPEFAPQAAYFSMEFGLDQALKTYSGGLGFLAGSHMRSAYELKQNLVGIGILWSFGYYDQGRNEDQTMRADFRQKHYSFLEDTGLVFPIIIHDVEVKVKAMYLAPTPSARRPCSSSPPIFRRTTSSHAPFPITSTTPIRPPAWPSPFCWVWAAASCWMS